MTPILLFDMDGTLVDTEHLHFEAFRTVLAPHGVDLSWADYRRFIMGHPNHAIAAHFLPHVPQHRHAGLMDDKEARYRALVTDVTPSAGLLDLLDWADAEAIPYAVVTNAPRANADLVLEALEHPRPRFKAVVAGDEVAHPKPHPMPYLTAAAAMVGGDPRRAVAFEDSGSGVASAVAAGLAGRRRHAGARRERPEGAGRGAPGRGLPRSPADALPAAAPPASTPPPRCGRGRALSLACIGAGPAGTMRVRASFSGAAALPVIRRSDAKASTFQMRLSQVLVLLAAEPEERITLSRHPRYSERALIRHPGRAARACPTACRCRRRSPRSRRCSSS